jgi:DNA-binding response OmpR family regulator
MFSSARRSIAPVGSVYREVLGTARAMVRTRARVVLVIEDDQDCRELYVAALTLADFRCVATGAPDEALRLAKSIHCDAVVMDIGLPRLADGLSLAWQLTAIRDPPPVIAVTGHPLNVAPSPLRVLLLKPVDLNDLVAAVERVATTQR